jgi:hypothetical protein
MSNTRDATLAQAVVRNASKGRSLMEESLATIYVVDDDPEVCAAL